MNHAGQLETSLSHRVFKPGTPLKTLFLKGFGEDKPFKVCSVDVGAINFPLNFVDYIKITYKSIFSIYLGFEKLITLTESRLWFREATNILLFLK